ncbi:MAG TPA: DUF4019 domain-containing protein, partial [Candidatus Acidoferrales bacterium]|nr:DUF4019 domain-containing protein [Candidatus Acidoferrales bacterium]
ALLDGLVLPGLVLNVVLLFGLLFANKFVNVWLLAWWYPILEEHAFLNNLHFLIWLLFATAAMIGSNYMVIRGIWRVLNKSANGSKAAAGSSWKTPLGIVAAIVAACVVAGLIVHHFHPERPFYIGQKYFPQRDFIEIASVERPAERMVVKGYYNLASHDQALLALYITTTDDIVVPTDSSQQAQISKGRGEFELVDSHLVSGLPHVSMYANGQPFASLYFGTKAEAQEESKAAWITNNPSATTNSSEDAALSAMQAWLALMDAGAFSQSWDTAADSFQSAVTKSDWVSLSEKVRQPLGQLISRKEISAQTSSVLPGMPEGSYFVAQFETSFTALTNAVETVEFMQEKDGQWKAAAYLIRPRTAEQTAAVTAAQLWLAEIDAGNYAESWTDAADYFRGAITQNKWVSALESVRKPLGKLEVRTVDSAVTETQLPGAPDGRYVVIQFQTAFAKKNSATETVTCSLEDDGRWRASGYYIK